MDRRLPSGTERARAFLPSKDFGVSKTFYALLGFTMVLEGNDVAIFATGESEFLLTTFYQREYAENFMMQLLVDDLDAWWALFHNWTSPGASAFPLPGTALQPWGCASPTSSIPAACSGTSAQRPGDGRVV